MPIVHQSLGDSLRFAAGETQTVFGTGKGGTGKSTIVAAIAHKLAERQKKVLIIDADGSPSSTDAFGGSPERRQEFLACNAVCQVSDAIQIALLSTLVPDMPAWAMRDAKAYTEYLNDSLDFFLPDSLDGHPTFLPVLRLALHERFYAIPIDANDVAYLLQILSLMRDKQHIVCDHREGQWKLWPVPVQEPDHVIIDTENTKRLLNLFLGLSQLGRSMRNIREQVDRTMPNAMKIAVKYTPNLRAYAESHVGQHPEVFAEASSQLLQEIVSTRTKVVVVMNPGFTEVGKTLGDIEGLVHIGKPPAHVLMNRWPITREQRSAAKHIEAAFLERLQKVLGDDGPVVGYSRVEPEKPLVQASPDDADFAQHQRANIAAVAETFGF